MQILPSAHHTIISHFSFLICTGKNLFQDKGVLSFVFNDITSALRWIQDISYKDKLDADQYQTQEKIRACVSKIPVFHFCYPYPIHMMLWKLSNSKCTESLKCTLFCRLPSPLMMVSLKCGCLIWCADSVIPLQWWTYMEAYNHCDLNPFHIIL